MGSVGIQLFAQGPGDPHHHQTFDASLKSIDKYMINQYRSSPQYDYYTTGIQVYTVVLYLQGWLVVTDNSRGSVCSLHNNIFPIQYV